jgi:hypothetical protein
MLLLLLMAAVLVVPGTGADASAGVDAGLVLREEDMVLWNVGLKGVVIKHRY